MPRKIHHWVSLRADNGQQDDFPVHEQPSEAEKREFNRWMVDSLAEMCYNAKRDFELQVTVKMIHA
jgi:hypothetical protein